MIDKFLIRSALSVACTLSVTAVLAQTSNNMSCGAFTAMDAATQRTTAAQLLQASGIEPSDQRIKLLILTCAQNALGLVQDAVSGDAGPD